MRLEPQVFDRLAYLVEHHDRVVPRDELLDRVWGHRFVADATLSSRIAAARRAVGDDGHSQRLIRTLVGRGFRVVGDVTVGEEPAAPAAGRATAGAAGPPPPGRRGPGRRHAAAPGPPPSAPAGRWGARRPRRPAW